MKIFILAFMSQLATAMTVGQSFASITFTLPSFSKLIIGVSYLCGLGFGVASLFKFKQHKDNPQQNTIGTPIVMFVLSTALVYLPGFYSPLRATFFGGYNESLFKNQPDYANFHPDYFLYK